MQSALQHGFSKEQSESGAFSLPSIGQMNLRRPQHYIISPESTGDCEAPDIIFRRFRWLRSSVRVESRNEAKNEFGIS